MAKLPGLKPRVERIVLVADLAGTAVFAIEGAITAMRSGLDLLGVMVIAFLVALGGGVTRDLLIGATPPNAEKGESASLKFCGWQRAGVAQHINPTLFKHSLGQRRITLPQAFVRPQTI